MVLQFCFSCGRHARLSKVVIYPRCCSSGSYKLTIVRLRGQCLIVYWSKLCRLIGHAPTELIVLLYEIVTNVIELITEKMFVMQGQRVAWYLPPYNLNAWRDCYPMHAYFSLNLIRARYKPETLAIFTFFYIIFIFVCRGRGFICCEIDFVVWSCS